MIVQKFFIFISRLEKKNQEKIEILSKNSLFTGFRNFC
jgi:uncharacterized membrane protein YqhA